MSDEEIVHLPECIANVTVTDGQIEWKPCICYQLRACKERVLDAAMEALMQRCDQLYVEGRISTMGQAAIEETIDALRGETK